jgi:hypothetical protein
MLTSMKRECQCAVRIATPTAFERYSQPTGQASSECERHNFSHVFD